MTNTENDLICKMQSIGIWKVEYMPTVSICARMIDEYNSHLDQFSEIMGELRVYKQKPPLMTAMESMRRDILAYLRELGLTPTSLRKNDKMREQKETSPLADALRDLGGI